MKRVAHVAVIFFISTAALAQSPGVATLTLRSLGLTIPRNFIGLSRQAQYLSPDSNESNLFSGSKNGHHMHPLGHGCGLSRHYQCPPPHFTAYGVLAAANNVYVAS